MRPVASGCGRCNHAFTDTAATAPFAAHPCRRGAIAPAQGRRPRESLDAAENPPKEASRQVAFGQLEHEVPRTPDQPPAGLEEPLLETRQGPALDGDRQNEPAQQIAEVGPVAPGSPPPATWAGASRAYGHGLRDLAEFSRDPCRRTARSPHKRHSGSHDAARDSDRRDGTGNVGAPLHRRVVVVALPALGLPRTCGDVLTSWPTGRAARWTPSRGGSRSISGIPVKKGGSHE